MKTLIKTFTPLALGVLFAIATPRPALAEPTFPDAFIPVFNVPQTAKPPVIDGTIGDDEWRRATRVMGVVNSGALFYKDRPISFWLAWDAKHLYLAARSDVLPGHRLRREHRDRFTTNVVWDDSLEFGIFFHDLNKLPNEASSFMKIVVNSLGSGEYMKIYPSIGQNMYNWQPEADIKNSVYERDGKQWWDFEAAFDLEDLQLPRALKAGDPLSILLAADLKNPEWQWLDYPSSSGHLEHYGFPRTTLTAAQPYVQIEEISGLHDEKLKLRAVIYNPTDHDIKVDASAVVRYGGTDTFEADSKPVFDDSRTLTIPAGGQARFDVDKTFPGLVYEQVNPSHIKQKSRLKILMREVGETSKPAIYSYVVEFQGTDKSYLKAEPVTTLFNTYVGFNPVSNRLLLEGDTLDAQLPPGTAAAGLVYTLSLKGKSVAEGRIETLVNQKFAGQAVLPTLAPGTYDLALSLVDAAGKVLLTRTSTIEKKDEAKEFARWWNTKIGNPNKVLKPFEAVKVRGNKVSVTRREYQLGALGLPQQIIANGGPVLARPARILVKVGGKEYSVPAASMVEFTSRKDWRAEFTGKSAVAGINFKVKGWIEQDGLVNLDVTYASQSKPVAIEDLRVEFPVDGKDGSWMSSTGGIGGNYAPRTIGKVPAGKGVVWDTLHDLGKAASAMLVGNWESNVWVGNDQRGLLWAGDDDRGWVPNDKTAAHSLTREGNVVVITNHIIHLAAGEKAFVLAAPRTMNLQYNATPFRHLAAGWRLTQVSAANGFASPLYKTNEKTGQEYFSILSPPSTDLKEWPEYYAKYLERGQPGREQGLYSVAPRLTYFLTNQIALRGYMNKTTEPGLYEYFAADWLTPKEGEAPSKTYTDYMVTLIDRQIREGGLAHTYFDVAFSKNAAAPLIGIGYQLPDGRYQPGSMDSNLRDWHRRVWALMQENDLYPGGVSMHATNSISLKALPWTDAVLDSEYPMLDPITVYPSDRMIALSNPHNFGVNISHLFFMNPDWANLHDSGMGGAGASRFFDSEYIRFGIGERDVQFLPYWRKNSIIKRVESGVLASVWKRPGRAMIQLLNYGPDEKGKEKSRSGAMKLDLKALGVPAGVTPDRLRIREVVMDGGKFPERFAKEQPWFEKLPGVAPKIRPAAHPTLNRATGELKGVDLFYHDSRYLLITWDDAPVNDASWKTLLKGEARRDALDWGLGQPAAHEVTGVALKSAVKIEDANFAVRAWKQPGTALLAITNNSAEEKTITAKVDLQSLGVKVQHLWRQFTRAINAQNYDATKGEITVKVLADATVPVFIHTTPMTAS